MAGAASPPRQRTAFAELHDLWRGDLRRLALVRVEQPDAADEVLTDVWLAIARGISKLDDPACFPRWAFQMCSGAVLTGCAGVASFAFRSCFSASARA